MLHFAVSSCLCVQLQPVDVLPRMAVQVTGLHGPVRAVCPGWAGHQGSSRPGEEIKQLSFSFKTKTISNRTVQNTVFWSHMFLPHKHIITCIFSCNHYYLLRVTLSCVCLRRLLMSAWLRMCSVQWRRWRRSISDECPRCQFMDWLSQHQRCSWFPPYSVLFALSLNIILKHWSRDCFFYELKNFFVCYVLGLSDSVVDNKSRERAWDLMINNLKICMPPFYFGITDMPSRFRDWATIWVICKILDLAFLLLVV